VEQEEGGGKGGLKIQVGGLCDLWEGEISRRFGDGPVILKGGET